MNVVCSEDHVYTADGVVIPGVTEVLSLFADYARVPRGVLEAKRLLGRAVHKAIELYEADELDPDSIDPVWQGYFEGWLRFMGDKPGKVVGAEEIVFHAKLRYAGRLDLRYLMDPGRLWLLDVKCTDVMSDATALQTAAYSEARNHMHPDEQQITKRGGLLLKPDGSYVLHSYNGPEHRNDFSLFCNALALRNWMHNSRRK